MAVTPVAKTARHAPVAKGLQDAAPPKSARQARADKAGEPSPLGCWAHGLAHLIEGDLENAKYWYRRARRPLPHGNTASAEIAALKAMVRQGTQ